MATTPAAAGEAGAGEVGAGNNPTYLIAEASLTGEASVYTAFVYGTIAAETVDIVSELHRE